MKGQIIHGRLFSKYKEKSFKKEKKSVFKTKNEPFTLIEMTRPLCWSSVQPCLYLVSRCFIREACTAAECVCDYAETSFRMQPTAACCFRAQASSWDL